MPVTSGLSTHDDTKHTGSAKRDTVGGVAGLDESGAVLGKGELLSLVRNSSQQIHFGDRTSAELYLQVQRLSADTYSLRIRESGVWQNIQTASMKNVANGIAGLDANALLPQSLSWNNGNLLSGINPTFSGWDTNPGTNSDLIDELILGLTTNGAKSFINKPTILYDIGNSTRFILHVLFQPNTSNEAGAIHLSDDGVTYYTSYVDKSLSANETHHMSIAAKARYIKIEFNRLGTNQNTTYKNISIRAYRL